MMSGFEITSGGGGGIFLSPAVKAHVGCPIKQMSPHSNACQWNVRSTHSIYKVFLPPRCFNRLLLFFGVAHRCLG